MSDVVHTITLVEPIKRGSEVITELKFKKCRGKHLKKLKMAQEQVCEDLLPVASKMTGQPLDVFDELCVEDFWEVIGYLGECSAPGRKTGEKPTE